MRVMWSCRFASFSLLSDLSEVFATSIGLFLFSLEVAVGSSGRCDRPLDFLRSVHDSFWNELLCVSHLSKERFTTVSFSQ